MSLFEEFKKYNNVTNHRWTIEEKKALSILLKGDIEKAREFMLEFAKITGNIRTPGSFVTEIITNFKTTAKPELLYNLREIRHEKFPNKREYTVERKVKKKMEPRQEEWITPIKAAELLRIQVKSVLSLVQRKRIKRIKGKDGKFLLSFADIQKYARERMRSGNKKLVKVREEETPSDSTKDFGFLLELYCNKFITKEEFTKIMLRFLKRKEIR